tara:strand:+ start:179 stop:409 length:231 start_codon:yes stop_codon:yes gene_type:complete
MRTEKQNRYYFKCIVLVLGNELGYHKFEMHEILKDMFLQNKSKELNKEEFNNYCEQIRIWAFNDLNINLMPPNEYE